MILCYIWGHKPQSHLDYIYGSLPREHKMCGRCEKPISFERPTDEREKELIAAGDIRDGDVLRGCNPI